MAEYKNVEKPFLLKLKEIGWDVLDHGGFGIPQNPALSLRTSFKEVTLKQTFLKALLSINTWLTDKQAEDVFATVTALEKSGKSLLEANKEVFDRLVGTTKTTVAHNEETGEEDALVKIIDFEDWENNTFTAINQFRIVTPGGPREGIIPDIVLFVNGLPFCVIECKDVGVADPLSSGIDQIMRYANTRKDDFGTKEGEENLFHYNLLCIATHGAEARIGTITGTYEYYLNWRDIFPEIYRSFDIANYLEEERTRYGGNSLRNKPQVRQEVVIAGLLNKEILLDVLCHFSIFMEIKEGVLIKVVCRYQQYRAVGKILDRLREGNSGHNRSGVVWHTQGSGKSLTMVFLVRKLRSQADLKDLKIIMTVDRKDLESQLSATAKLTNEFKESNVVKARRELIPMLGNDSSDLNMVMIHKFVQDELKYSASLMQAFVKEGEVPEFKPFEMVNSSERILILIDEAHRTQGGDMGDNLFAAFPNAAKIAFTGTPLLTERHKQKTHQRFGGKGEFIDTYKIKEAVEDRATLDIIYIGKTTRDNIKGKQAFNAEFEDVFREQTEEERTEIQKRYGTMQAYLENMDRLRKIAVDLVDHYIKEILPNGYKAMVVANSILAAARYERLILQAIDARLEIEKSKPKPDLELIEQIEFLEACTVVTKQDNNEAGFISEARNKTKEYKAVENFKHDFDYAKDASGQYEKPKTGVAFLCVCDKLLTGFDAPIAQVMYLDKNLREHDLLQAIARVNRTKGTKSHGILVDYYGVSNNLKAALNIYGSEDEEDFQELLAYFKDIDDEIPVLEARYNRLLQLFADKGISDFEKFAEQTMMDKKIEFQLAEDCIALAESIPFRAQFDTYLKAFFDSLDLLFHSEVAHQYYIPAKRFGYLLMRIRNRYKDPSLDLKWAKPKVRKMIDTYLETLGIDSTVPPINLLSDDFMGEVKKLGDNPKNKASEMEHAIRRHIKVNFDKDPILYKTFLVKMEEILERYKDNWELIVESFTDLRQVMNLGREGVNTEKGLEPKELPFYDLMVYNAFGDIILEDEKEQLKPVVKELVKLLETTVNKQNFWQSRSTEIRNLEGEISDILDFSGISTVENLREQLTLDIMMLAKRRHLELTKN